MSDPSLDELLRKLRENTEPAPDAGEATRARIQESLRRGRPRRRKRLFFLIAAVLGTSSALAFYVAGTLSGPDAAAVGARGESDGGPARSREQLDGAVTSAFDAAAELAESGETHQEESSAPGEDTREALDAAGAEVRPRATPDSRSRSALRRRAARKLEPKSASELERRSDAGPAQVRAPTQLDVDALYASAHRLHFRGDPAAALAAWEAYLRVAANGARALEARYNRGVVLMRLGRSREAREALAPFAEGQHGSFRQAEAKRLLEQLAPSR